MIEIEFKGLDKFDETKWERAIKETREDLIRKYKGIVDSHFVKDDSFPAADTVDSPAKIKIHWPKRIPHIRIRTGVLKEAIVIEKNREGANVFIDKGKAKYADLVHSGGRVKPKKRLFLAVGIQKETYLTPPSRLSKRLIAIQGALWEKLGPNKWRPLYLLKKEVEIPPRPFLLLDKAEFDRLVKYTAKRFMERVEKILG